MEAINKTILVIYANASSLFDQTNGASKSIKLLLESLAAKGCDTYAVMGCTSDSKDGFQTNQEIWLSQTTKNKISEKSKEFTLNRVQYSLIATEHWSRRYLAADEQEAIYRISTKIISKQDRQYSRKILIGWGNLLLEEAIFRTAKRNGFQSLFYLANPTYAGKKVETLRMSSKIITDSLATKRLYSQDKLPEIHVVPKCIEKPKTTRNASHLWHSQTIIFVNPQLRKGLEALVIIAEELYELRPSLTIEIVDSANRIKSELKHINKTLDQLPKNIRLTGSYPSTDKLLKHGSLVLLLSLWHESGSRLIHESHLRGMPVIAFNTGGNAELMGRNTFDIFEKPITTQINGHIRIRDWNPTPLIKRILELMSSIDNYKEHSEYLLRNSEALLKNNEKAAQKILEIA